MRQSRKDHILYRILGALSDDKVRPRLVQNGDSILYTFSKAATPLQYFSDGLKIDLPVTFNSFPTGAR